MFIRIGQNRQEVLYQMKHYNVSGCDRDAYKIPPPALKVFYAFIFKLIFKIMHLCIGAPSTRRHCEYKYNIVGAVLSFLPFDTAPHRWPPFLLRYG